MSVGEFGPFVFLASLADPVAALPAIGGGLLARRWWHLIPASLLAPAAHALLGASGDHWSRLLPFLLASGAIWSGLAFAAKRAWRG